MRQIDRFKIKQEIKDAIFSRLSSVSGVLSITLVGSFIDSDNLAGISDIDTIVVCEKLNDVIFKQCTEQIKSIDISRCGLEGYQLKIVDAVLLLTIPEPGRSGQKFDMEGLVYIEQLNAMQIREKIRICVDGGVNEKIAPQLQVENIVSGSSVLNHKYPKNQILCLQTAGRYEAN